MEHRRTREDERRDALRLRGADGSMPRRCCEWAGCDSAAEFRAPKARDRLREFQWFCLEHIRQFNLGWDYFAGMSQADIDSHRRADVTWHRPTWRYGTAYGLDDWRDVFGLFVDGVDGSPRRPPQRPPTKAETMMARLGLAPGYTLVELKRRYKKLAKEHHPDLHGGDKAAEERLKLINEAYTFLREQQLYA